jgi:ArsR family transcriptional regulator, virulence genes transcriptional regulator
MGKESVLPVLKSRCDQVAAYLKILSHPQRLKVLSILAMQESTVSDLLNEVDISQSQLSQFLAKMRQQNLVKDRRDGGFSYYSISDAQLRQLLLSIGQCLCKSTK